MLDLRIRTIAIKINGETKKAERVQLSSFMRFRILYHLFVLFSAVLIQVE